jgi:hypothetical protein
VRLATRAALVIAVSGVVALVAIGLFFSVGQPFGTINDIALLLMTLAIAPVMLGSYELGGVTPLWPARLSLGAGIGAVLVWSAVQLAMIVGLVSFDYDHPAHDAFAVEALALLVIGAWLTGAPLLAGPWLPPLLRWLGAISGVGFVAFGVGLLRGGVDDQLTILGGLGYQIVFPVWAYLLWRLLRSRAASSSPGSRSGPTPGGRTPARRS